MQDAITIRQLLDEELERRGFISDLHMTAEDLFDKKKVMQWINKLIGETHAETLKKLMEATTAERLGHAAATYLLGIAVRDRLQIPFDLLPKLITNGSCDGFHYFWALICLCHDLGYRFEHYSGFLPEMCDSMDCSEKRKKLLGVMHDMMDLSKQNICDLSIDEKSKNGIWIEESIGLINGYDEYRREKKHTGWGPKIDHGIAGSLLLYNLLRSEYEQMKQAAEQGRRRANELRYVGASNMIQGVAKHDSAEHFLVNSLVIACTVGRHNMWLAEQDAKETYTSYKLTKLHKDNPGALVRGDCQQEQMLFLLDFMDTIDPVKGIYLREAEWKKNNKLKEIVKGNGTISAMSLTETRIRELESHIVLRKDEIEDLESRKDFLLNQVKIRFVGDYTREKGWECRWGDSLTYRKIEMSVENDVNGYFAGFVQGTLSLNTWLKTRAPELDGNKVAYYFPVYRSRGDKWPYGITDQEVNALLLYEGCGVPGKYGEFYTPAEAYQTLNLLMMPGMEAEKVRIIQEKQHPRGVYIKQWKKTMEVMLDIFTAQCKYAIHQEDSKVIQHNLWRCDRELNLNLMRDYGGSFAFTSTSRDSLKDDFLKDKRNPQILHIMLGEKVPYFDYEGFFGNKYVYSAEREVLLPPLLKMECKAGGEWGNTGTDPVSCHEITFTGFSLDRVGEPCEDELIDTLDRYAEEAADVLTQMVNEETRDLSIFIHKDHPYWLWKHAFQQLILRCMTNIYMSYFYI